MKIIIFYFFDELLWRPWFYLPLLTCWNKFNINFIFSDRSTTKGKTFDPCWNEIFIHEVTNAKNIGLTVFHDAAIPPDDFVANCTIAFEDLAHRDKEQQDFWVSAKSQRDCLLVLRSCNYVEIKIDDKKKHTLNYGVFRKMQPN